MLTCCYLVFTVGQDRCSLCCVYIVLSGFTLIACFWYLKIVVNLNVIFCFLFFTVEIIFFELLFFTCSYFTYISLEKLARTLEEKDISGTFPATHHLETCLLTLFFFFGYIHKNILLIFLIRSRRCECRQQ